MKRILCLMFLFVAVALVAAPLMRFVGALGVAWSPSEISGIQALFDANDLTKVTKDGSDLVSQWASVVGTGNSFEQATAANKPTWIANQINGKAVLRFDGSDDFLSAVDTGYAPITVGNPRSFFAVFKHSGFAAEEYHRLVKLKHDSSGRWTVIVSNATGQYDDVAFGGSPAAQIRSGSLSLGTSAFHTLLLTRDTGSESIDRYALYIDGVLISSVVASSNIGADDGVSIISSSGGTEQFKGDMAELGWVDGAISAGDRAKLFAYWTTRYGIYHTTQSPNQFAGLQLWLDANDASTITKDGSDLVSEFRDKSGNARHFEQSTSGRRPTWISGATASGQAAINFPAGKVLQGPSTELISPAAPFTLAILMKPDALSTAYPTALNFYNATASHSSNLFFSQNLFGGANLGFGAGAGGFNAASIKTTISSPDSAYKVYIFTYNGAGTSETDFTLTSDNATQSLVDATGEIGSGENLNLIGAVLADGTSALLGRIKEICIYNRVLPANELQSLYAYLAAGR